MSLFRRNSDIAAATPMLKRAVCRYLAISLAVFVIFLFSRIRSLSSRLRIRRALAGHFRGIPVRTWSARGPRPPCVSPPPPSPRARRRPFPRRLPWICRRACRCPNIHPRPQGAAAGAGAAAAPGLRLRLRTRRPPLPRPDPLTAPLGRGWGKIFGKRRARRLIRGRRRRLLRPRL